MTYWLGAYLLVAISVAVPFLLLYLVGFAVRLVVITIGSQMKRLTNARPGNLFS